MSKNTRNRLLVIAGVILVSLYFTFPLEKNINLGLDLKGGMHLVLQVDMEELKAKTMGDRVPEYQIRIPAVLLFLLGAILVGGAAAELLF